MSNTVTGRVLSTKRVNSSYYGNPAFMVELSNGAAYRTQSDASIAYAIQNLEFTLFDYVFMLSRAGRIVSAKRA